MAYLDDHPPVRDQWWNTRTRPLTGCTVLHTAESVMDTVGPDTGAEAVAEFIRTRSTPGSYHDLCDSDTALYLVDYTHGAYHDGTGSNNWALSISWACGTHHWRVMTAERRRAFLRQGAVAFVRQQAWRKAHGYPATALRRISRAESEAGASGFIAHGDRDPGRRTDPGIVAPNLFPWDEWFTVLQEQSGGGTPPPPALLEEDQDMFLMRNGKGTVNVVGPGFSEWVGTSADHAALKTKLPQFQLSDDLFSRVHAGVRAGLASSQALAAIRTDLADEEPTRLAAAVMGVESVRQDLMDEALALPATPGDDGE